MPAAPQYKPPGWLIVAVLAAILISLAWLGSRPPESGANPVVEIGYSEFRSLLAGKSITEVTFHGRELAGRLKQQTPLGTAQRPTDRFTVRLPDVASPDLLKELEAAGIDIKVAPDDTGPSFRNIFWALVPWLVLFGLYWWIWRRSMGNMAGGLGPRGGVGQFLEGRAREEDKGEIEVTFEDVAGQDNAKREVSELVDFLKDPERYMKLGATVPHGVLLIGPPGTGKTLLARALAGEAGVPFFSISASEFIEVFVGVGASRVRHMFDEAKKRAPAIIFIDELDSIGRVRGTGLGGGHDEREQTLNQILSELDGFTRHEAVIVIAATNRPDVLDPALLRPGRFDRHVTLELPDQKARRKILDVHVRNVPLAANVDLDTVASGTPGFSGADLKNLVNEAAMAAARDNGAEVTAQHFDAARDRIIMGAVRSLVIEPEEQRRLAIHESGHTVVAHYLPHSDPIYKVTVIPRGQALGATHQLPEEERYTLPDVYLKERLAVMLAGRAAEKIFLDSVSSGADDDIKQATALARAMVTRWGMSDEVGPVDVRQSEEHPFLGREIAQPRHFSERTAEAVDKAVHELLTAAEAQAAEVITEHRAAMEELMAALVERETLERDEITAILGPPHGLAAAAPSAAAE